MANGLSVFSDLTLWFVFTTWLSQHTALSACPPGLFGYLCQYQCHCAYGYICDVKTGACLEKCDYGWKGMPSCQIQNIALDKNTFQDGHQNRSVLAVDGNRVQDGSTNRCTRVLNGQYPFRAMWHVDLGIPYSIKEIKIYFRNDDKVTNGKRRQGVRVYVSNTSEYYKGALCYSSQKSTRSFFTPPDILELRNCTHKGRYVTLVNERPVTPTCSSRSYSCWANLEICEVEVFACAHGTYGPNCDKFCACKDGLPCDPITGICPSGCAEGRKGPKCDEECPKDQYGKDCSSFCTNCKNDAICDIITGKCPDGCQPGWRTESCNKPCPKYKYGDNCTQPCGNCMGGKSCDPVTGKCTDGCARNWYGDRCDSSCPPGTYGGRCDQACGHCLNAEPCNSFNGKCPNACAEGYMGDKCLTACPKFSHGKNCMRRCGFCKQEATCHHITGVCPNGCMPGYNGTDCMELCNEGFYGEDCLFPCEHCMNHSCNQVTGTCSHGCSPGWKNSPQCNEKCDPGFYGEKCVKQCGPCFNNEPCHHRLGTCRAGCEPGWTGAYCTEPCEKGKFGLRCEGTCGHCVNGTACHHTTGVCDTGCETGYYGTTCSSLAVKGMSEKLKLGGIIGGAVAAGLIVAIVLIVCIVRKKRKSKPTTNGTNTLPPPNAHEERFYEHANINHAFEVGTVDEIETTATTRVSTDSSVYYNTCNDRGTLVSDLGDYINMMEVDEDKYMKEFEELKTVKGPQTTEAGRKKENKQKNRFLTTFPYDHTRVILKKIENEENSDYINASYIDSVDIVKAYIATQGPNKHTVRDFWRMIWQERCSHIVMLTNLIEEGKVKCEQYWPVQCSVHHCDLTITLNSMTEMSNYTIRDMTIQNKQSSESRKIVQFHFTGWPDHGVPDTLELVTFLRKVHAFPLPRTGPTVVHCSAGVGRTGTYIGLDSLYKYGLKSQRVDILGFVKKMRENRMTMIQNVDQYRLLHFALLEVFTYKDSSYRKSDFVPKYAKLTKENSSVLQEEFQILMESKPIFSKADCISAVAAENVDKNRSLDVLAVERFRPYLSTHVPDCTDYINAVILPSCKSKDKYIVTQCPLAHTISDFWRLVFDHDINTIVSVNQLDEDKEGTVVWWPSESETVNYGPLVIKTVSVGEIQMGYSERTFTLTRKDFNETRTIKSFHLVTWPWGREAPQPLRSLLSVIEAVENWKRESLTDTVLVQCIDGAKCSGVFTTLSLALDRLRMEQEVDIFHTLRRIQSRRPQIIQSLTQYRMLYDAVSEHIETTGIYSNT